MTAFLQYLALNVFITIPVLAEADKPATDSVQAQIQTAVSRGLTVAQKAAASYPKHRNCFSCHHQTLPMLAMVTARSGGIEIDRELLQAQAEFTHQSFAERKDAMKEGKGIGGTSMTVGYGLWALDLAGGKPDDTTEAMVTFLLKSQHDDGRWARFTSRPPLEDSNVTCTVLAAYGMQKYASEAQRADVEAAIARAKLWLAGAAIESQEDRAAKLWGLHLLGGEPDKLESARDAVLAAQREDGGWSQLEGMASDAYATGQSLFVLRESGLATSDPAYERGVRFLLRSQCEDGSWLVETRSKPIQTFFDNGDPHGKHQFISIPATSWAVAALAGADRPR